MSKRHATLMAGAQSRRRFLLARQSITLLGWMGLALPCCVGCQPATESTATTQDTLDGPTRRLAVQRRELCLQLEDLAAMGCEDTTLERLLEALAAWQAQHAQELATLELAMRDATGQRVDRERASGVGGGAMPQRLATDALLDLLRAAEPVAREVLASQSAELVQLWRVALAGRDLAAPGALKHAPGLTVDQLAKVERDGPAGVLTAEQEAAIHAAQARLARRIDPLREAERRVLERWASRVSRTPSP